MARRQQQLAAPVIKPEDIEGTYENAFPPDGKLVDPPPYEGAKALSDTSKCLVVELDVGAFRYLTEQLQADVRLHWNGKEDITWTRPGGPAGQGAARRALEAFRRAALVAGLTRAQSLPPDSLALLASTSAEDLLQPEPEPAPAPAAARRCGRGRPPKAAVAAAEVPVSKPQLLPYGKAASAAPVAVQKPLRESALVTDCPICVYNRKRGAAPCPKHR